MLSILVLNLKGGCGKTTLATNLAGACAAHGLKVALAEVDRQKSALTWLKSR
ncbi:MAG: ParA family protein, partial [Pseudomonadota bacterium]